MLGSATLKSSFAKDPSVDASYFVLSEININQYATIAKYGVYTDTVTTTYQDVTKFRTDVPKIFYNGGSVTLEEEDTQRSKLYSLKDCFKPRRPRSGFAHLMYYSDLPSFPIRFSKTDIEKGYVRYYPSREDARFKYWSSATSETNTTTAITKGISSRTAASGAYPITEANPFVVYDKGYWCNKIVIKLQNLEAVPKTWRVQYLAENNSWTTIATNPTITSYAGGATVPNNTLELFWNGTAWVTSVNYNTIVEELTSTGVYSTTRAVKVKGIRLLVESLDRPNRAFELFEMSARLLVNVTDYVIDFNVDKSIAESSAGLPVANIITAYGSMVLDNSDLAFNNVNTSSILYGLIKPQIRFDIFEKATVGSTSEYIPIKTVYAESFAEDNNFNLSMTLKDHMLFLQTEISPNVFVASELSNSSGTKMSILVKILLDNIGFTNFRLETSNNADPNVLNQEDTPIPFFYSNDKETVMETLNRISAATQCVFFFDELNDLVLMTKERIMSKSRAVDAYLIGEEFTGTAQKGKAYAPGSEYWKIDNQPQSTDPRFGLLSNIESFNIINNEPVNGGTISYKPQYFLKKPMTDSFPVSSMQGGLIKAFTDNLVYNSAPLWEPEEEPLSRPGILQGSESSGAAAVTLSSATLIEDLSASRPIDILRNENLLEASFKTSDDVVRFLAINPNKLMTIKLDPIESLTFGRYENYLKLDEEYVKFRGKIFEVSSRDSSNNIVFTERVIFTPSEYEDIAASTPVGGGIRPTGKFVIDVKFEVENGKWVCKTDGRGQFQTAITNHQSLINPSLMTDQDYKSGQKTYLPEGWKADSVVLENNYKTTSGKIASKDPMVYTNIVNEFRDVVNQNNIEIVGQDVNYTDYTDLAADAIEDAGLDVDNIPLSNGTTKKKKYQPDQVNIGMIYKNFNRVFDRYSTRLRLVKSNRGNGGYASSRIAGMAFGLRSDTATNQFSGYYVEIETADSFDPTDSESLQNNLRLYRLSYSNNKYYNVKLIGSRTVAAYHSVDRFKDYGRYLPDGQPNTVYDLEISHKYIVGEGLQFNIFFNGLNVLTVFDESPIELQTGVALFVRGQSDAVFEFFRGAAVEKTLTNNPLHDEDFIEKARGIGYTAAWHSLAKYTIGNPIFVNEEFGKIAREARFFDIRYKTYPAMRPRVFDISEINPEYSITKQEFTGFGAKFLVTNVGRGDIVFGGRQAPYPLFIFGIPLYAGGERQITVDSYLKETSLDAKYKTNVENSKRVYGEKQFNIGSEFIQKESNARNLMKWVVENAAVPTDTINAEVFPNPLYQLGDIVKVYYPSQKVDDTKRFVITRIEYGASSDGPSMNITAKEVPA
jgi:hypothetical protein